jgi:alpha-galactosidase
MYTAFMTFDKNTVPPVTIKEGKYGDVEIIKNGYHYFLNHNGIGWHQYNTKNMREYCEQWSSYDLAYGDVLISGFGFGQLATWLSAKPEVTSVTCIEVSQDVVNAFLTNNSIPDNVEVIISDIYEYKTDKHYDCIILNHSNPMAAICRTVKKYSKIKIIGYCHNVAQSLPIFAGLLDVEAQDLDFLVGGINHMTWLLSLRHKGRDVYPELKRRILNSEAQKGQQFTKDLLQAMDLFMMGGDRHIIEFFPHARQSSDPKALHYGLKWRSDMISENLLSEELTRGAAQLQARAEGTKPLYIPKHVTPEAMGQQIKALTQGPDIVHVVNIPNEGAIPNLPDWALVEVKAVVGQHGARPVFVGDLPAQAARWTLAQIYAHELTIEAAAEQSRSKAIQALACDPMIRDFHEAEQVLDALIEVQGDRLASFMKKIGISRPSFPNAIESL